MPPTKTKGNSNPASIKIATINPTPAADIILIHNHITATSTAKAARMPNMPAPLQAIVVRELEYSSRADVYKYGVFSILNSPFSEYFSLIK